MTRLELPEQLRGRWHHCLILSYGADIPFFENALWGQFGARCRNKIILADGQRYLESCASYAGSGLVRHLNHRYVAEGILTPHAAHSKLILLTNPERGRLLVGSGNLGWQGYASGGELFTQYEYSSDAPEALNAFLTVRELVDGLNQYIGAPAVRRIRYLWEETPWLFKKAESSWWPVRHNLRESFLDQLREVVGGEPVEELWVLSPFYDKEAVALERLLEAFDPRQATLLVQPGQTSVDPTALQRVLDRFADRCTVRSFGIGVESSYAHAKLFLLRLASRAICLQGSPNLSQVAMLLTVPQGNVELANLLTGRRGAFDELLTALDIQTDAVPLGALDLHYQSPEPSADQESEAWRLTGGEWYGDRLYLRFQGTVPALQGASLVIANRTFPLYLLNQRLQEIEVKLNPAALGLLQRPVPVAVRWGKEEPACITNPVFVCNRAALDAILEMADEGETLHRIGSLDLDDTEFEQLLADLEASLVLDRRSVWAIAGKPLPATTDDDDAALRLDYAEVDYEMIRQHPRLQQYVSGGESSVRYARSRLQVILSAITDHFRGLLEISTTGKLLEGAIAEVEDSQAETEEEREQEEEEKQRLRRSQAQRLRRILKNFVRRYLRGIQSPDFQELAGFEVIAQNYIIFSHILWRLFSKDWVEPKFLCESLMQTWSFFWGHGQEAGYSRSLDAEQRAQVLVWIREHHSDAELLAASYHCAYLARTERWKDLRVELRDFWRGLLVRPPLDLCAEVLEEAWHFVAHLVPVEPPRPTTIVNELERLASFETRQSFLHTLERRYGYRAGSCRFEKINVRRMRFDGPVAVMCLVINAETALESPDATVSILQEWVRFEDLDYYRIASPDCNGTRRVFFCEVAESIGVYWARDRGEDPVDLEVPIYKRPAEWDPMLSQLHAFAQKVDAELVLPVQWGVPKEAARIGD